MRKAFKILILFILLGIVSFFSYNVGVYVGEENILRTPPPQITNSEEGKVEEVDFSVFWEAWRNLEMNFLEKDKIDSQNMVYGAIQGMVESLKDPYTTFFTPQETEEFNEELSGEYQGVGMIVGMKNDQLTVISPLEGSPAQEAGLRAGDKILKIEDTYTEDISIDKAVSLIRGPKGTKVKLLIERKSWEKPKEVEVRREVIKIPTLEWEIKEENIALIKIYQFNGILSSEFKKAALEILNSPARKIILDLRNNPGGYLEVAQEITGWFLERGEVVVLQESEKESEKETYKSEGPSRFSKYPTVILINEGSASGAEIMAGALRDNRGVQLIGEISFGKGSVQEQVFLSNSSSLKVTIAKWLTPKGYSIAEQGLIPDIEVEMTDEDFDNERDPQLDKAIEVIKNLQ